MPIYEFECAMGHRFEKIMSINQMREIKKSGIPCEGGFQMPQGTGHFVGEEFGNGKAYLVWSKPSNIQIGKPTIVFINPQTGTAQIATSQYDVPPPGFIKEELKGPIERSKFEKQQSEIAKMDDLIFNEDIRQKREEFKDNHLKMIDKHLREDAQSSDNPELTVKLMNAAKDRIKKKDALPKKRKTEFGLAVNHTDKSNLD